MFLLGGTGGAYLLVGNLFRHNRNDLLLHKVQRETLPLTIVERGTLEAADNREVVSRVKAGARNAAPTIKWVIDDGSQVKQGDKLVELDSSALEEQLKSQKITLDTTQAAAIQAEENYKIVVSQIQSDLQNAKINIELIQLDLEKYLGKDLTGENEGEFRQQIRDIEGRISMAESDVEVWRDRVAWDERMVKKKYLSPNQAQADTSKLQASEISLAKVREELHILKNYSRKRTETELRNRLNEAKRNLERIENQAKAREAAANADQKTKRSVYEQEYKRYQDTEEEIRKCTIIAPQDGMVVYVVPETSRMGGGGRTNLIAQGETVTEGQKLMRIPNLDRMMVNTKVHEAMVSKVRQGQPAVIRIDAFPDQILKGHVEQVATVADAQDRMSADVKVYKTMVAIDDRCEGLKPGMSAEVTITIGDSLKDVLSVPVHAIFGSAEKGKQRQVYVLTPNGPVERDIVVGGSNDTKAEVKSGLEEGEEVVLNPRVLGGDKIKTRPEGADKKQGRGRDPGDGPSDQGSAGQVDKSQDDNKKPRDRKGPPGEWKGRRPDGMPKKGPPAPPPGEK